MTLAEVGPAAGDGDETRGHPPAADLRVTVAGLELANPIVTASGCFASGPEIDRFFDISELGAVVVKSMTVEPRQGLGTPRMAETPSGMLNAIGLQNPGVDRWLERDLPWLRGKDVPVIASVAGRAVDEYRQLARRLRRADGVAAVEVNISCPNVEDRGRVFACHPGPAADVLDAVSAELSVPVFAKLTPDVTDVTAVAEAVVDAGADGLSLINTTLGMAIDPETGRPALANVVGGLSGPAIRPIAVRNVHQVHQHLPDVPIIGMGGVRSVEDVVEMMRAGASAVAVGTATFLDPFATRTLIGELREWCGRHGLERAAELTGAIVLDEEPSEDGAAPSSPGDGEER